MDDSLLHYQSCCLYFTTNSLSRIIEKMAEKSFAPTGLSPSYGYLLLSIVEKPGLSQKELCSMMNLQPSTMTRFVDKLLLMELIEKQISGRETYIFPTSSGILFKEKIQKALEDLYKSYVNALGEDKALELTKNISDAINVLSK